MELEFDYTVTTAHTFDSAVKRVEEEIEKGGMRVLHIHDVQKTLADKGFDRGPFKIIEFCSAPYADALLNADMRIGLCMPCKINVYTSGGQTAISGMRPGMLRQLFPDAPVGGIPEEIDQKIKTIIDNAKRP